MGQLSPYRVKLWDIGASRGRGTLRAIIDDPSDVGVSSYANDMGEMFFTLPGAHPQITECEPLLRHYEVQRRDIATGVYSAVGVGILEDYEATMDEVVLYGHDYLGFLTKSITTAAASATDEFVGTIIQAGFTVRKNEADSPIGFVTQGTIDTTTRTVTVIAPHEEYLSFWQGLVEILAGAGTTRPIFKMSLASPPAFSFDDNAGVDRNAVRLELGGAILDYRFSPGLADLRYMNRAIGIKREGATVLYATVTTGSRSQYGDLGMSSLYTDVINAAELQDRGLADLKDHRFRSQRLFMSLAQGHTRPLDGWDIADSIRVRISRGIVDIDALYTIWGWEWIGRKDGSESLFLDLQPKLI